MQSHNEKFVLVIPTLNEAGNIQQVLDRSIGALSATSCTWRILVVDDASADGTVDIVREYAKTDPRIDLLIRHGERGLAGAITYGWAHSSADLLGVIDADLQHPPELIPALIAEVSNGTDIAIASRYVKPHSMDEWNPLRRLISRLSIAASRPLQRPALQVKDPMSGFFVLRRECIEGLRFQQSGFKLLLEILAKGRIETASEVPFTFTVRQKGRSKANLWTAVHYLLLLLKLSRGSVPANEATRRKGRP